MPAALTQAVLDLLANEEEVVSLQRVDKVTSMNYMANRIVQSGRYFSSGAFRSFRFPWRLLHLFEPNVGCGDCKPPASSSDLSSRFFVSLVGALPHPAHALCAHIPRWVELRVGRFQHAPALG